MFKLSIHNLSVQYGSKIVLDQLSFTLNAGQGLIIRGESGSGKTTLGKAVAGQISASGAIEVQFDPNGNLPKLLFVDSWYRFTNLEGDRNFYYQQRYNHQQRKDTVTVAGELKSYGKENGLENQLLESLLIRLNYHPVLEEQLFEISSGEHKKLQLIRALWLRPQLLIIDQPYTGLDQHSRSVLNQLLDEYLQNGGALILLSNDSDLPQAATHFAVLKDGKLAATDRLVPLIKIPLKPLPDFLTTPPQYSSTSLVRMKHVNVRYEDKQVLKDINWEVKPGEKWLLQGHNGSGKSTLLSLITADHPQAYANDIRLFGVKRGGGESIWDIKKRIGLISPELHWYFDGNATVSQSLASGFFDANGQYQRLRYSQKQQLDALLHFFGLYEVKDELLAIQPLGKQRLALLGRTIIKTPQLLVLDEPCQGLDRQQTQYFNDLTDAISKNGVTIIYVGHFESQLPRSLTHKLVLQEGQTLVNTKLTP